MALRNRRLPAASRRMEQPHFHRREARPAERAATNFKLETLNSNFPEKTPRNDLFLEI
jgi:hypothetical protein